MARSFWPKEHGAYAQLGLPLATALVAGRPRGTAAALTVASVALFFAHEPALVLLGRRGPRALREAGAAARTRLAALLAIALFGVAGLVDRAVLSASIVPASLLLASVALVALDRERTMLGEAVIATCLASAAVPVAIASGWSFHNAVAALLAWAVALLAATIAVRGVIAARKKGAPPTRSALLVAFTPIVAALLAMARVVPWWTAVAVIPVVLVAIVVAARPPHPRALRAIGWALVAATTATGATIALGVAL